MANFGNLVQGPNLERLTNYAKTNWHEILEGWQPISIFAYVRCTVPGQTIRGGWYEYISETEAGALIHPTEEFEVPVMDGLLEIPAAPGAPMRPPGRVHLMINGLGDALLLEDFAIYRGSWDDVATKGVLCWWGYPVMPNPFGINPDTGAVEPTSTVGADLSMYTSYIPGAIPPPPPDSGISTLLWTLGELNNFKLWATQPSHSDNWTQISNWANAHLNDPAPAPVLGQGWRNSYDEADEIQRWFYTMAFMHSMTDDTAYAQAAATWIVSITTWLTWTNPSGHWQVWSRMLRAMAFAYDTFRGFLTDAERTAAFNKLITETNGLYNNYVNRPWFGENYPNHKGAVASGVGMSAVALGTDYIGASDWLTFALQHIRAAYSRGGVDGGWFEGGSYVNGIFLESMPFIEALRRKGIADLYTEYDVFLRNLPYYCIYMNYNNRQLQMEDCTGTLNWLRNSPAGASFAYRLAAEYNDGYANGWADLLSDKSVVESFIWKDPSVVSRSRDTLPLSKYFSDIGYVIWRAGWSDNDLLFIFKSGSSEGHAHNDQNGWQMYKNGNMVSGGPGYVTNWEEYDQTKVNNCLLVDGLGQAQEPGDLGTAPLGTRGLIQAVETGGLYRYVRGDASAPYLGLSSFPNYPSGHPLLNSGQLDKWLRHVVFVENPNYFVIFDDVGAATARRYDYLLQGSNYGTYPISITGNIITISTGGAPVLRDVIVEPANFLYEQIHYPGPSNRDFESIKVWPSTETAATQFLNVLFPNSVMPVEEVKQGNCIGVIVDVGTIKDLVLFSTDGFPVDQLIELNGFYKAADGNVYEFDGTRVRAQFDTYQVIRLEGLIGPQAVLTIAAGAGGTTDPAPGTWSYDQGAMVTVTAIPLTGYSFVEWQEDGVPISVDNPVAIVMDTDRNLTAVFEEIVVPPGEYALTISVIGEGTTQPAPGAYTIAQGQEVTVVATPFSGYKLDHWEGDVAGTSPSVTFPMNSNMSIIAVFTRVQAPQLGMAAIVAGSLVLGVIIASVARKK